MEAKRFLQVVGEAVTTDFIRNRNILSFEEYMSLFLQDPQRQARNSAQYLRDVMDHFGTEEVRHPAGGGKMRRFKLFDLTEHDRDGRVAGQEEVQNDVYRLLGNFVRAGRVNKLIMLHGPNGSAKSTFVNALKRAAELYSRELQGALYRVNWIFPTDKLVRGSIGFGGEATGGGDLASYAHLDPESIDQRITCTMKDHPIFLVPLPERRKLLEQTCGLKKDTSSDFVLSDYISDGELCGKCRRIYATLIAAYNGDYLKALRHVQVERFYISRRYQTASTTVEPQISVDAGLHQVSADPRQMMLPAPLQNLILFDPHGPLVNANRGIMEYSDLLKRPLEAFKYLLGASETGEVPLELFILQLDEVLIASSNEKHLAAFKELPDFASFKGRIELVRVPYVRRYKVEQQIYEMQITPTSVGKHVAPHVTEVAAMWAVLTRLKKPIPDRYKGEIREIVDGLRPLEKMYLYEEGKAPDRLGTQQVKELRKNLADVYGESDDYPNYEGRSGASAREIKTALFNAAQNPNYRCLNPLAVFEELEALCRDKSVYEFLQQEVVDGYHAHEEFVRTVQHEYLDRVDAEVRDSMGLISERQYEELFERYIQHVSHWVKGERMRNRVTGDFEKADENLMTETEKIVMPRSEDAGEFRRGLISSIGAHRLDNPDAAIEYPRIFPDIFRRLRDHFFEERKRVLKRNAENILRALSDESASLSSKERTQVEETLQTMEKKFGYCRDCAKDAIIFLTRERYA